MSHSDPYVDIVDFHFDVTSATALRDGGLARVWYTGDGSSLQLYGQVFDPLLRLYKDTFTISIEDGQLDTEPDILALDDGGFLVSWSSNGTLYAARYDWRGETEVEPFLISDRGFSPAIAELEGGNIAIIWEKTGSPPPYSDITGAIFDADGNLLETLSDITGETASWQREASVAPLESGGFVVTWETDTDADSITNIDYDVQFRIFDQNGGAVTDPAIVSNYTEADQMDPDVATLDNGNFVIVWSSEHESSYTEHIYGRVFDGSGAAITTQVKIDPFTATSNDQVLPSVAALQDGGFYVSWGSHNNSLYGQRFDENGSAIGNHTTIESLSSEQHYNADVSVSGDGRVFISWQYYTQDNSSFGLDTSILTMGEIATSLEGTAAADKLTGTAGIDHIDGYDGDDTLKGVGADDTLYGGDGADFITGGDGDDLVAGGAGNDQVYAGGGGSDIIRGDGGDDTLGGGSGSDLLFGGGTSAYYDTDTSDEDGRDVLYGGSGDDILVGGNWNDADNDGYPDLAELMNPSTDDANILWAGEGDDITFGAHGRDTLGGGDGNDIMLGLDGNDIMYGGKGDSATSNDTLDGGSGDDRMFAGLGNDSLSGGTGRDVLYGGEGNDILGGGDGNDTLWGGNGNDFLNSGEGDDLIYGGSGADQFVFTASHGTDTVYGFSITEDNLDLKETVVEFSSISDVEAAATNTNIGAEGGVLIETGAGNSIFLVGLSVSDLGSIGYTF